MFKIVGEWWNDKNIELVNIDGVVYALNNWNGETYNNCWICTGDNLMDASDDEYIIKPIYKEVDEDEFEIIDYIVID